MTTSPTTETHPLTKTMRIGLKKTRSEEEMSKRKYFGSWFLFTSAYQIFGNKAALQYYEIITFNNF